MVSLDFLKAYLAVGRPLFPCSAKDKRPLTPHGFKDATLDLNQIADWHAQHPDCAWGTPTSAEYAVVDVDPRNGGLETWDALIREHGPIPTTPTIHTGGEGWHYVFRFPEGTRCGKLAKGVDLKADGGYVIVPPSRVHEPHHTQPYRWTAKLSETPTPDACEWLVVLANKPTARTHYQGSGSVTPDTPITVGHTLETHPGSPEGERRVTLCRLVGSALGAGVHPDQVWDQAEAWAGRCDPPFGEWERHVRGLVQREAEKGNNTHHQSPTPSPETGRKEVINSGEGNGELITYFLPAETPPVNGEPGVVSGEDVVRLHPDAYHGPLGQVVHAVSPHTEADNPALLVSLLAAFGSACGYSPHFNHGKPHGANLFVGLVGPTASRKGTATGIAKAVIADAEPEWETRVQHEGFGSGEGLIWAVRDPSPADPVGVTDKRLLVIEEEWAKAFTLSASDKSILTPIIRNAFDRIPIGKANKGDNAYGCRQPHISIVGHITSEDLRQSLTGKNAVNIANGFLNRFLLVETRRTKFLPRGGRWREHATPFLAAIRDALTKARSQTLMVLDAEAEGEWDRLYPSLETRPEGVPGAVTGRASDQVMKLAMVYALADGDNAVRVSHLRAGLAVWRYCEATAFTLFGTPIPDPEPDPLWLRLLNAITQSPGVRRGELVSAFKNTAKADAIGETLEGLKVKGMAYPKMVQPEGGGRPAECWYPGNGNGNGEGEKGNNTLHPSLNTLPPNPFAGLVVGGEEEGSKEVINSPTPEPEGELVNYLLPSPPNPSPNPEGEGCPKIGGLGVVQHSATALDADTFLTGIAEPEPETAVRLLHEAGVVVLKTEEGLLYIGDGNPSPHVERLMRQPVASVLLTKDEWDAELDTLTA